MALEPQTGPQAILPVAQSAVPRPVAPDAIDDGYPEPAEVAPLGRRPKTRQEAAPRVGRRRTGPARERVAANDDAPSIGTLIYSLQQQPSSAPFYYAAIGTGVWATLGLVLGYGLIGSGWKAGDHILEVLTRPTTIGAIALLLAPIAVMWFLALLVWRAHELRLMSSAMTEVALRLAEPDRMAEQSIAALGQSVRRQVSAMNDAISRAIGRAGELEVLVHNEVSALERSYDENENRIRNLIDELVSEREALSSGSDRIADTLKGVGQQISENIFQAGAQVAEELSDRGNVLQSSLSMISQRVGSELPVLLEKLSREQERLSEVVVGATTNLDQLQEALDERTTRLDSSIGMRTKQLQSVLQDYSTTIDGAIAEHADTLQNRLGELTQAIESTNAHIEDVLSGRTDALDAALVERTKAIDHAFATRMAEIDESIERSSLAVESAISRGLKSVEAAVAEGASVVDGAIGNRVDLLRSALERHAGAMGTTLRQQSEQLETTLVQGLDAMRRNTDNITTQSAQTVSGLATQGRMLKDVSEGLLGQLQGLVDRFDQQNRVVTQASNALESSQGRLSVTSREMAGQLGKLTQDINVSSREMSGQLGKLTQDINAMTVQVQTHLDRLPEAARESASGVRLALQDQVRALDQLAAVSREQRLLRDAMPPEGQDITMRRTPPTQSAPPLPPSSSVGIGLPPISSSGRDAWSLGDLLARASLDEADTAPVHTARAPGFDLAAIAAAIDPMQAATAWARHRIGERGVINRSIYTLAGQTTFDQIAARLRIDNDFRNMADRYIADFERVLSQAEQRDPTGGALLSQMQTETGRVFLLLAHASGRVG
jgi:hypothetical protein